MLDITHVYLITGFLGSGKTTLLNRIVRQFPPDKKLTLLVNEFGEVGVDGILVEDDDIDIMEINKGSIFCVCVKTDFIKGLYKLSTQMRPDVMLIESTGVANPSDLKKDLKLPIFNDRFDFREQFCVIDAAHFLDAYGVFASLEKQIESSTRFIINKIDNASHDRIEETKDVIRQFHPDPVFYDTTYADIPLTDIFDFAKPESRASGTPESEKTKMSALSEEALDRFIDDLLDSPDLEISPPDMLVSVIYRWHGDDLAQVRAMAGALPPSVVRAKGFVGDKQDVYLFSYVMGDWTIEKTNVPRSRIKNKNIVVFIGPPDSMEGIDRASQTGDWTGRGMFHPYSPPSKDSSL